MNIQRRDVNCKEERMNVSNSQINIIKLNIKQSMRLSHALIDSKVTDIFQNKQIFITKSYIVVLY